jgi:hypothetical protein
MLRNTLNTFITATLIMLLGVSSSAKAIVPMGDLMGTTSVTFGEGIAAVTYSSALKIDFVPKAPVLSSIERQTLGDAKSATATFSITSRANGPADYTLASEVALTNLDGVTGVTFDPASIENLGATAVVKVNAGLLVVPSDGVAGDAEVNGIEATDKVMIDGVEYTVEAVEDDGVTATITLQGGLGAASPSMGTPIWEKREVEVTLTDIGDVEKEGPSNVTVTVTASYDDLSNDTAFIASRTVEVLPWARTYVRNTTDEKKNPEDNVAADLPEENAFEVDGTWYFSSLAGADPEEGLAEGYNEAAQVKAAAGDTLEYVIVVSAGNTLDEQAFSIEETFPPFAIEGGEPQFIRKSLLHNASRQDFNSDGESATWNGTVAINQSARFVYTLQLGEAEEVESEDLGGVEGTSIEQGATGGGESINDRFPPGTPWRAGVGRDAESPEALTLTACWCHGEDDPEDYCREAGWAVGANEYSQYDGTDKKYVADGQADARSRASGLNRQAGSRHVCR